MRAAHLRHRLKRRSTSLKEGGKGRSFGKAQKRMNRRGDLCSPDRQGASKRGG